MEFYFHMTGHIFIEGEVGQKVTIDSVRSDIALYPQADSWDIHIDSPGGDVDTGFAIGAIIGGLKNTTANIGALCASISTYIAHSCDTIVMGPAGDFTIHLPTGTIGGNAEDHRKGAARLDRITNELINRYMTRVQKKGITREQVAAMITQETSMSPGDALKMGFVDDVREKLKAVAKFNIKYNMEAITKEEAKGMFESLGNKIDKLFNSRMKAKNLDIVLADGTPVTSDAATPDAIVGSNITDATGASLADGEYETMDGFEMEVAGGIATDYSPLMNDAEIPDAPVPQDQPAKKKTVAPGPPGQAGGPQTLADRIAAIEAAMGLKNKEKAIVAQKEPEMKAEAKTETAQFMASIKELKDELTALKKKTFGDETPPAKNTTFKAKGEGRQVDPMLEQMSALGNAWGTSRSFPEDFNAKFN